MDIMIGRESPQPCQQIGRTRLLRIQRVDGLIRLAAGVRLDLNAVRILGTLTIPLRHVEALQRALGEIATAEASAASAAADR